MKSNDNNLSREKLPVKYLLLLLGVCFLSVVITYYSLRTQIIATTCMTIPQVQADSRCLYIYHNSVYFPPGNPHHGHNCRTDVGNSMPGSHSDGRLLKTAPYYIADICSATPTPTPTPTAKPTPRPTLTPTTALSPTATPVPGAILFSVTICPHGIANCGDNANPNGSGNTVLGHQQRTITIDLTDSNNTLVATKQGPVKYQTTGNFTGTINMNTLAKGNYLAKVKMDGFLAKRLPAAIQVSTTSTITIPPFSLIAGDTNNDNKLDILDYNNIIGCLGSKQTSSSCTLPPNQNSQGADINDSGKVDGVDYNLILRELSVQPGG